MNDVRLISDIEHGSPVGKSDHEFQFLQCIGIAELKENDEEGDYEKHDSQS